MTHPTQRDIEQLLKDLVVPFYDIKRDMLVPSASRRPENDAEHSWSLALLACSLADRTDKNLDLGKIAQLAIVHDLVEIYAGDTSVWNTIAKTTKDIREKNAVEQLEKAAKEFPWIMRWVKEYEAKSSNEALFVWAVDKYIASLMRYLDYQKGGRVYRDMKITRSRYINGIEATRKKAHAHPVVKKYYEEILAITKSKADWFYKEK